MNKKLIDKYGFKQSELDGYCCFKVINGNLIEYNEGLQELYIFNNDIGAGDPASATTQTSIRGVVALVLDCTGVDLAKKTKREEIEELKRLVGDLDKENNAQSEFITSNRVRLLKLEDTIKSQNKAIEGLKLSKPLEIVREIAKLTLQLKKLEQNKELEKGGVIAESKSNESVLSERTLGVMKKTVELVDEQAVEMQAEEAKKMRGFEVDDRVVIKPSIIDESCCPLVASAAKEGNVYLVGKVLQDFEQVELAGSDLGNFSFCWIEHAPAESPKEKALEWGDFRLFNGDKVLIVRTLVTTALVYYENGTKHYVNLKHLKAL